VSHCGIPIDRSCGSYRPGHQVHWIHAKKASEKDQPLVAVSITFRGYGWVDIQGRDLSWTLWTHEATRLHQVWDTCGCAVWKTRWHMLSLPGPYGSCFNMATWDERTPCLEKVGPPADLHTTVDRVLWEARTYGGYTVPMSSMTPGEAAKVVEELRHDDLRFRHRAARNADRRIAEIQAEQQAPYAARHWPDGPPLRIADRYAAGRPRRRIALP
jgi:hypothetical protein